MDFEEEMTSVTLNYKNDLTWVLLTNLMGKCKNIVVKEIFMERYNTIFKTVEGNFLISTKNGDLLIHLTEDRHDIDITKIINSNWQKLLIETIKDNLKPLDNVGIHNGLSRFSNRFFSDLVDENLIEYLWNGKLDNLIFHSGKYLTSFCICEYKDEWTNLSIDEAKELSIKEKKISILLCCLHKKLNLTLWIFLSDYQWMITEKKDHIEISGNIKTITELNRSFPLETKLKEKNLTIRSQNYLPSLITNEIKTNQFGKEWTRKGKNGRVEWSFSSTEVRKFDKSPLEIELELCSIWTKIYSN